MTRLLHRASLRFYLLHPWQLALAIAGVSLGVGVFVGVELANDSANRAFELSAALLRGQTTHRLLPIGRDMDERLYAELVVDRRLSDAAPVIETEVGFAGRRGLRVPLLGIDPIRERGLRAFSGIGILGAGGNLARMITEPGTVLLPDGLAAELDATPGSELTLVLANGAAPVRVLGTVPSSGPGTEAEPPVIADIATVQELVGRPGRIDRIDLRLSDAEAAALGRAAPPGTVLVSAEAERSAFNEIAGAFRTNLTALGLLALVVGTFLIYGTMSFAILQRRPTYGVLRAMGLARRELVATVLAEGLAVATAATILGLLLGHWLAQGLVRLVLQTIGDLYFSAGVKAATPSPWIYVQGAALGLGATLFAAAKPALDAANAPPASVLRRATLEREARRGARVAAISALPILAGSGLLVLVGPGSLYLAFAALFGVLAAGALLTPSATLVLMGGLDRAIGRYASLPLRLALKGVGATLSRTGVATAALTVAIATVNGVGLMISSFRTSLDAWLDTTLTADVYATFDSSGWVLDDAVRARLSEVDGIESLSLTRALVVPTNAGEIVVRAVQPGARGWGLDVVTGIPETALAALADGQGVIASERLLFARGLAVGDSVALPTPHGTQEFPIVGAFRDFNTGNYSVVMTLERFQREWQDLSITGLGATLSKGAEPAAVEASLRTALEPAEVRIRSSVMIRTVSLEIFDRTFKITEVLRMLAAIVAFLGVLSALLAIELERAHESAVLRALGFSPRQLATNLLAQTGLLGLAAGLLAVPLGTALAGLLVYVINRRSFGWTMDLVVSGTPLIAGLALGVAAAVLAGIYPSWRASRTPLAAALREE